MKLSTSVDFEASENFDNTDERTSSTFLFCKCTKRDFNLSAAASWPPKILFSSIDNSTESFLAFSGSPFLMEETSTITDEVVGEVGRKYLLGARVLVKRDDFA